MQDDLSRVDNWSDVWQIEFNYKKCNHMHLGIDQSYSIDCMLINSVSTKINQVEEQNDIGVTKDNDMKIILHIQLIVKKANRNLGIFKRMERNYLVTWIKQCF